MQFDLLLTYIYIYRRRINIDLRKKKAIQERIHAVKEPFEPVEQLSKNYVERVNALATCKRPVTQNPIAMLVESTPMILAYRHSSTVFEGKHTQHASCNYFNR